MTIVEMAGRYYIPFMNGFKEINHAEAMQLYEEGYITSENVIEVEVD